MGRLQMLSAKAFAKEIGVSVVTLSKWNDEGVITPYLITPSGRKMYLESQVDEYFEKYRVKKDN